MDIDGLFDPPPRQNGRASRAAVAEYARDLEPADLVLLETERGIAAPRITQLRDSHHALARCLSSGMRPAEASLVTGYSPSRISILQADPTFGELLVFYREQKDEIFADLHARMSTLSLEAESELRERLHETPEQFTPGMLLEVLKTLADRTGYGPSTRSTNVNLNIDIAGKLERARRRAIEHRATDAINTGNALDTASDAGNALREPGALGGDARGGAGREVGDG